MSCTNELVVDLFSGIGGLSLGFKLLGFETIGIEIKAGRSKVYELNVGKSVNADIRHLDFHKWRDAFAVIAGPPCRPYSVATPPRSRGRFHPEYGLDIEIIRAAADIAPKYIIIEEVPHWNPRFIAKELRKLGYSVIYRLIPFAEYGIPTTRRRWLLIGAKRGVTKIMQRLTALGESPPNPIDLIKDLPQQTCEDRRCIIGGSLILDHVAPKINSKIAELIPLIPPGHSVVTAHKAGIVDASKYVNVVKKHSYWLYRPPLYGLVKVVPYPRRSVMLHPAYNRAISVRELARLYTYPDWFTFEPLSIDDAMRAIADSVPPKFSLKLALAIAPSCPN